MRDWCKFRNSASPCWQFLQVQVNSNGESNGSVTADAGFVLTFFANTDWNKCRTDPAFAVTDGCRTLQVVTDGEEAINYLKGDGKYADRQGYPLPKLIVMDIKMPRRTGFEVLEWVKGDGRPLRRIPIVIVSSSDNPADINRAYELGANAYMVKPVNFKAVEHLFESITHYWGLECAKPVLEMA